MIGWRQISESLSVTMRVATSAIPPAGYGKTMWMRRLGKSVCAFAGPVTNTEAAARTGTRHAPATDKKRWRTRFMASSSALQRLVRALRLMGVTCPTATQRHRHPVENRGCQSITMLVISNLRRPCYWGIPYSILSLKGLPYVAKDRLGEPDRPPAETAGLACILHRRPARQHGQGGATPRRFPACRFRGDR